MIGSPQIAISRATAGESLPVAAAGGNSKGTASGFLALLEAGLGELFGSAPEPAQRAVTTAETPGATAVKSKTSAADPKTPERKKKTTAITTSPAPLPLPPSPPIPVVIQLAIGFATPLAAGQPGGTPSVPNAAACGPHAAATAAQEAVRPATAEEVPAAPNAGFDLPERGPSLHAPLAFATRLQPRLAPATREAPAPSGALPAGAKIPEIKPPLEPHIAPSDAPASAPREETCPSRAITAGLVMKTPVVEKVTTEGEAPNPSRPDQPAASGTQPRAKQEPATAQPDQVKNERHETEAEYKDSGRDVPPATPRYEPVTEAAALPAGVRPGAAELRRPSEPAPEPARVEIATAEEKPATAPARTAHEISLRLPDAQGKSVEVRMVEQGGEVRVAVRTPDHELAQSLRENMGNLTRALESRGYQSETWQPTVHSSSAGEAPRDSGSGNNYHPGARDGGSGQSGPGHHGDGSGEGRRRRSGRPAWVEELDGATDREQPEFRSNLIWQ